MGRGTARATISVRQPKKGARTSQADRAAYRQASREWYDNQIKGLQGRIERPRLSSRLTDAEIKSFNDQVAYNASMRQPHPQQRTEKLVRRHQPTNLQGDEPHLATVDHDGATGSGPGPVA